MQNVKFWGMTNSYLQIALIMHLLISATASTMYGVFHEMPTILLTLGSTFYLSSLILVVITIIHYYCVLCHSKAYFEDIQILQKLN